MPPRKLYLGPLTDNRRWDRVALRPDDVIVVTPPKSGTTWMQVIVALLLSGDPEVRPELAETMPWVDIRIREIDAVATRLAGMSRRRSMKSHTPLDGLPVDPGGLWLCVFRHPLDAHVSFRHHVRNLPVPWFDHWYPEEDPTGVALRRFLDGGPEGFDGDALTLAHILRHYEAARALADRPNVALFHFADLKRDLAGTMARVAGLLGVSHPPGLMRQLVRTARFDTMKRHADRFAPLAGGAPPEAQSGFFRAGRLGDGRSVLSEAEQDAYDAVMSAALPATERAWLEYGSAGRAGSGG